MEVQERLRQAAESLASFEARQRSKLSLSAST